MRCDVCNAAIKASGAEERITSDVFVYLLDNGFGLDETNIKMLTDAGMSRSTAESLLKEQYRQSNSDWLLCPQCVAKATAMLAHSSEQWIDSGYLAVTRTAEDVGLGFDALGAPVALSRAVWHECVEWSEQDAERQTYQEQDARLWDVMFTGGGTLQLKLDQFLTAGVHRYSVLCVPRDGKSTHAIKVNLLIRPKIIRGQSWLVIDKAEQADAGDADKPGA